VAPALLVPAVVSLALIAVLARRRWLRVVLVAVPALVISGPAIIAASRAATQSEALGILLREPGPRGASPVESPLHTLLTLDTAPAGGEWYAGTAVVAAIALTVCVAATIALLSGRAARAVRVGWVVAALGLATAFVAQRVVVAWPDGAGSDAVNGCAAPALSLALVGALASSAAASSGVWHSGGLIQLRRSLAVVVVTAAAAAVLVSATAWAWPGRASAGDVAGVETDVLPLVAALEQEPPTSSRVLVLADTDAGVAYSVESFDGAVELTGDATFDADGAPLARPDGGPLPAPRDLAHVVATLVGAGVGADQELAAWGIGVIVAHHDSPKALAGLSQVDTLELMGASDRGTAYRVPRGDAPVSRAWLETVTGAVVVDFDGSEGSAHLTRGESGTLIVAAPADAGWAATLAGEPLASVEDEAGRQAFAVPSGGGRVVVWFEDATYRAWWWAAAIVSGIALLAAIPIHDRRMLGQRS
jgi:hypothetical protein